MDIFDLTNGTHDKEFSEIVSAAAAHAIARTHAAGRPSTHGDEKGIYHL